MTLRSTQKRGHRPFPLGWSGHIAKRIYDAKLPELWDVLFHPTSRKLYFSRINRPKKP